MRVIWTPLHAALGIEPTALTFEIAESAIEAQVAESEALDFKRDLPLALQAGAPHEARAAKQAELGKDIAAMANSGGGLLLYGMEEDATSGRSVAKAVHSVGVVTEQTEKSIRQVAGLIYPAVRDLVFRQLVEATPKDPDEPRTMLALLVPDSSDRPHLIHPRGNNDQNWFMTPYRNGPDTAFMTDRMLQSAYVDRERGQRRMESDFEDRFEDLLTQLPGPGWIVVMAMPENRSSQAAPLERWPADQIFKRGFAGPVHPISAAGLLGDVEARRGLRRFVRRTHKVLSGEGLNARRARAYAEVHADGAVAVAFTHGGHFPLAYLPSHAQVSLVGTPDHVSLNDMHLVMGDFAQLLWASRQDRPILGAYRARLAVHPHVSHFRERTTGGSEEYMPIDLEDSRIYNYRPIDARLTDDRGDVSVLESIQEMFRDAYDQANAREPAQSPVSAWIEEFQHKVRRLG